MLNTRLISTAMLALGLGLAMPATSVAETAHDHDHAAAPAVDIEMTDGQVKKVDLENGKLTIKHGYIKSLDMPGMTMVFTAQEKSLLDGVKPGDKIKFQVVNQGGKLVITALQRVQ